MRRVLAGATLWPQASSLVRRRVVRHAFVCAVVCGLAVACLLFGQARSARADWKADGTLIGDRGDVTAFGSDGRGGMFAWVGYPWPDEQFFVGAEGDTLPGWPVAGIPLVPGNNTCLQHESFEPVVGVPDGAGGTYLLVAEQGGRCSWAGGFLDPQQLFVHRRAVGGGLAEGWDVQGVQLETRCLEHRFDMLHHGCMVADGDRGVFVAWMDQERPYSRLLLQRVTARGVRKWGTSGVYAQQSADACTLPTLAADGQGGVFVFWGRRDTSSTLHVQGQHVLASGALAWGPNGRVISTRSYNRMSQAIPADGGWVWQYYGPAIAATPDNAGGALVFWSASEGADLKVFGTRVAQSGRLVWRSEQVVCSAEGDQSDVVCSPSGRGKTVVAWRDARRGQDVGFYAQSVTQEGRGLWARNGATVCADSGQREMLQVEGDGAGGAYFAWLDFGRGYQLFAQRLGEGGAVPHGWSPSGTLVNKTARPYPVPWTGARSLRLVEGARGSAMLGWADSGTGTYAIRLTPSGLGAVVGRPRRGGLPATAADVVGQPGFALVLWGVSPNPASAGAVLRFSLPDAGSAHLDVIDLAGRRVWSKEVGALGPGEHAIRLADGARFSKGIYFVRLTNSASSSTKRIAVIQ